MQYLAPVASRSDGIIVDNTLDYESRDHKSDNPLFGLSDETLNRDPVSV